MNGHREASRHSAAALVALLALAYVLAFAQRQLPAALAVQIKQELSASDAMLGALHGSSFGLLYAVLAVPAGCLVDRGRRVPLLAAGLGLATLATLASAAASGTETLIGARLLIGVGQAVLVPAALSLIGDALPRQRMGLAVAGFHCGPFIGAGLMLIGGGWIASQGSWRSAFLLLGLVGLVPSLLLLRQRDLVRHRKAAGAGASILPHMRQRWRALLPVLAAMLCTATAGQVLLGWAASALVRAHGLAADAAGALLGTAVLFAGTIGAVASGAGSDLLASRSGLPRLRVLAAAAGVAALLALACFTAPSITGAAWALFPLLFFLAAAHAIGPTALQEITPPELRGRQHGAAVLLLNLFGMGAGPLIVGMISDRWGDAPHTLARVLAAVLPALLLGAATAGWLGARAQRSAAAQVTAPGRPDSTV